MALSRWKSQLFILVTGFDRYRSPFVNTNLEVDLYRLYTCSRSQQIEKMLQALYVNWQGAVHSMGSIQRQLKPKITRHEHPAQT